MSESYPKIVPFDRHDAAHPIVHRMSNDEEEAIPNDAMVQALDGLVAGLRRIEACCDPLAAAIARETLAGGCPF
jgi:lysozyme family protein